MTVSIAPVDRQVDPTSACQEALAELGLIEPTPDPPDQPDA